MCLVVTMLMWLRPKISSKAEESTVDSRPVTRVVSEFASPTELEALEMVKQALTIREPAEISGFFRPCDSSPEEIIGFLSDMESRDGQIDGYQWLSSMDVNRLSIDGVLVNFTKESAPKNRLALLTPDAEGKWLIDFDAFAQTVKPAWSEILKKETVQARVRVILAEDSYFNGPFREDEQWKCYGMASPDSERIVYGYCKVGSPQAECLEWIFSKDEKMSRATLDIRRLEGGGLRQFEISTVIAEGWVVGKTPLQESFTE